MQKITGGIIIAVLAAATIAGCGGGGGGSSTGGGTTTGGTPTTPVTAKVAVTNNSSAPMGFAFASPITVKSGTAVSWANQSSAPHSIIWDDHTPSASPAPGANIGLFSAGATSAAWTAPTVTANTTYDYHCGVHGPTMAGKMIVTP